VATELLGSITGDQKDALGLAINNIGRLGRLINELLDISKIEAGKLELRCESVDMGMLIQEVVRNFEPLARERGLELRAVIPAKSLELLIDRDKVVQVFTNLIQNALKFTEKGYVEVSASVDDQGVRCQVADTGPGIQAKDLPKVFGKFQQFGHAPQGREKGTGLGLSLCKGFVELHGGRIWIESQVGIGTQFIFVFPRIAAESLFKEQVRQLFEAAVSHSQPLTLISFGVEQWKLSMAPDGKEAPAIVLHRLQAVVKSALGVESVTVVQGRGAVWLALPEIAKTAAEEMAKRVRQDFEANLQIKVASYPDDGNLPEQLLQHLAA
jgi:two-component sensor histidine kinase